jgi:4a-hydroxytetrahydrobiopterin dehydratase
LVTRKATRKSTHRIIVMIIASQHELTQKRCQPCEGGVEPCPLDHSRAQMAAIPAWVLTPDGRAISRTVRLKHFVEMLECVNQLGALAEADGHHPDLHLTGYRILKIELTTHAIGGLSENDFILAAKFDRCLADQFPNAKAH